MSETGYRPASYRSILLGVLAALALFAVLGGLPLVVKIVGLPLMLVPSLLGITELALPADVQSFSLAGSPGVLEIRRPGRYALYTGDWNLLETTEAARVQHGPPWLALRGPNGATVPVTYIERGLRPYDTPFAPGRPVFTFQVESFGLYQMQHPKPQAMVGIVPDYVTGRERTIALAMVIQVALVLSPFAVRFGYRHWRRRVEREAAQAERRQAADEFWRRRARPR